MDIYEEISDIERFRPKGASLDYLEEVEASIEEINETRPLQPYILEKLQREILYDRVHASAVIEGNQLSRRETIIVLSNGIVEAGSRKEKQEVVNLADCCMYLQERLDHKENISMFLIKELHQKLLSKIDDNNAGRTRQQDVSISGAKVRPPSHTDVDSLMERLTELSSRTDCSAIQKATWIHWAIARIHPFSDGNGRVARLIQDFILLQNHYLPATVQPEDREKNYYEALEQADLGDGTSLLELTAKNILKTAERYLSIIREERSRTDWIQNIAKAATEKVKQSEHRKFLALQRAYDAVKLEFNNVVNELSQHLPEGFIGFKNYGSLDFDKYQSLKTKGRASRTWLFGIHIKHGDLDQRFIFWYAIHFSRPDDIINFENSTPSLLVSMQDSAGNYQKLDDINEDRITIREIVTQGRSYLRRRFNPVTDTYEWDKDVSPSEITRDFFQEVLSKTGLI